MDRRYYGKQIWCPKNIWCNEIKYLNKAKYLIIRPSTLLLATPYGIVYSKLVVRNLPRSSFLKA